MAVNTASAIASLLARFGNKVVHEQANLNNALVAKGVVKKKKTSGQRHIVNIKAGGMDSTGFISDAAALPSGSEVALKQGVVDPVALFSRLSIPRVAAEVANGASDAVNLVKEQMQSTGEDLGRTLARAMYSSTLGALTAAASATNTAFRTTDPSGYRVGQTLDFYTAAGTLKASKRVKKIVVPANGDLAATNPATITLTAAVGAALTAGINVYLKGAQGNNINSLADCAANASLHSLATTADEWHGNLATTVGALTLAKMRDMSRTIRYRSRKKWSHVLASPVNCQRILELHVSNIRYTSGKADESGLDVMFEGKSIFEDDNAPDGDLFFHQQDDCYLAVWREPSAQFDGKTPQMVSDTSLVFDTQFLAIQNFVFTRRNSSGRMTGITS